MIRLYIWLGWHAAINSTRVHYRRARYLLWAKTRHEPPVRRLLGQEEELHAAVLAKRAEAAVGIRRVDGVLRDRQGRFAAHIEVA